MLNLAVCNVLYSHVLFFVTVRVLESWLWSSGFFFSDFCLECLKGRVRVLALIVKLFSMSSSVASEVSKSNLLNLLEAEVSNSNDTLVTLSVLELIYEVWFWSRVNSASSFLHNFFRRLTCLYHSCTVTWFFSHENLASIIHIHAHVRS